MRLAFFEPSHLLYSSPPPSFPRPSVHPSSRHLHPAETSSTQPTNTKLFPRSSFLASFSLPFKPYNSKTSGNQKLSCPTPTQKAHLIYHQQPQRQTSTEKCRLLPRTLPTPSPCLLLLPSTWAPTPAPCISIPSARWRPLPRQTCPGPRGRLPTTRTPTAKANRTPHQVCLTVSRVLARGTPASTAINRESWSERVRRNGMVD